MMQQLSLLVNVPIIKKIIIDKKLDLDIDIKIENQANLSEVRVVIHNTNGESVDAFLDSDTDEGLDFVAQISCSENQVSSIFMISILADDHEYTCKLRLNFTKNESGTVIIDNCDNVGTSIPLQAGDAIIKNSSFDKDTFANLTEDYIQLPLVAKLNRKKNAVNTSLFVRVDYPSVEDIPLQAFRQKARFGRGVDPKDTDVRLFQSLHHRMNNDTSNDASEYSGFSYFSRAHFCLEFDEHGRFLYRSLSSHRKIFPVVTNLGHDTASPLPVKFERGSTMLCMNDLNTNKDGLKEFSLFFELANIYFDVYLVSGVHATILCEALPHLGEIVIFNTSICEEYGVQCYLRKQSEIYVKTKKLQWYVNIQGAEGLPVAVQDGGLIKL